MIEFAACCGTWTCTISSRRPSRGSVWTARGRSPRAGGFFAARGPRALSSVPAPAPRRVEIRDAREADLAQIAATWDQEVIGTDATTDTEPRADTAQREWLARHSDIYPVIVAVTSHDVVAYGSLTPYQPKPAFARTVEDSVYVRQDSRGAGLGAMILAELVRRAPGRGPPLLLARLPPKNTAPPRPPARPPLPPPRPHPA